MTEAAQAEDVVRRLPFLARLPPALSELVSRLFQPRSFDFGDTLFAEGDRPDGMYVLVEGSVRVLVDHNGQEITLGRVGPGEWFGENSLLDGSTRSATVRASEAIRVLWLDRLVFDALLELHPEVREAFGEFLQVLRGIGIQRATACDEERLRGGLQQLDELGDTLGFRHRPAHVPNAPLEELRRHAGRELKGMVLLRAGNRLSITPVEEAHWKFILTLE